MVTRLASPPLWYEREVENNKKAHAEYQDSRAKELLKETRPKWPQERMKLGENLIKRIEK